MYHLFIYCLYLAKSNQELHIGDIGQLVERWNDASHQNV